MRSLTLSRIMADAQRRRERQAANPAAPPPGKAAAPVPERPGSRRRPRLLIPHPETGAVHTVREVEEMLGIKGNTVVYRYHKYGPDDMRFWAPRISPPDVALGGATRKDVALFSWNGRTMTARGWAEFLGITVQAFWRRVKKWGPKHPKTFAPAMRAGKRGRVLA